MENYKYHREISKLKCDCPPKNGFEKKEVTAFRWVHSDFDHPNNFIPVCKISPNRLELFNNCEDKCLSYGISLYDSLRNAEKKLTKYLKRKPKLVKVFGNSIAKGTIDMIDGLVDKPNETGHFTLHESIKSNLKTKFTPIKEIVL